MKKFLITSTVFLILFVPSISLVYAQGPSGSGSGAGTSGAGSSAGISQTVTLTNPLSSKYSSIPGIVGALLNVVEYIGAIACALWIIWAGFLFVKAQGKPEELSKAKLTLLHAIIGTLIILGAGAILAVITNVINTVKAS